MHDNLGGSGVYGVGFDGFVVEGDGFFDDSAGGCFILDAAPCAGLLGLGGYDGDIGDFCESGG